MPDSPSADRTASPHGKWDWLLNSTVATACVSLLITAIVGNITLAWVQQRNKDHEFQLLAYKENLAAQLKTVDRVYQLIGSVRAAAEDLITVTQPQFDPRRFPAQDAKIVRDQIRELGDHYSKIDQQWRAERESLGFLMVYYHHGQPEVLKAWENMQNVLNAYTACAEKWHNEHVGNPSNRNGPPPCQREADETSDRFSVLTVKLAQAQSSFLR